MLSAKMMKKKCALEMIDSIRPKNKNATRTYCYDMHMYMYMHMHEDEDEEDSIPYACTMYDTIHLLITTMKIVQSDLPRSNMIILE